VLARGWEGPRVNYPPDHADERGALTGAIVAGVGGLFAFGVARAVVYQDLSLMFRLPMLGMVCLLISGPIGWVLGGRLGPFLARKLRSRSCEILGGIVAGLLPVGVVLFLGWYLTVPH
jgi:hypothetical protein